MLSLQWFDFIGFAGVTMVVLAYLALQTDRLDGHGFRYSLLNLLGAAGILVPVVYAETMNFPVLFIETIWMAISAYGIWNSLRTKIVKRRTRL